MGMYTEMITRIQLKPDIPDEVLRMLSALAHKIGFDELDLESYKHPLFYTERYQMLLASSSYYHLPRSTAQLWYSDRWYLHSRSDLKNYDDEIELFFQWIAPFCQEDSVIGWSLYEEDDWPTIYRVNIGGELVRGKVVG